MTTAELVNSRGINESQFGKPLLVSNVRGKNVFKGDHIAQRPKEEKQPAESQD